MRIVLLISLFICVVDRGTPWRTLTQLRMTSVDSGELPKLPKVGSPMPAGKRPDWFHVPAPGGSKTKFQELKESIKGLGLHTVCEEAKCPNIGNFLVVGFLFSRFLLFLGFR
jgi:hypothetical protein